MKSNIELFKFDNSFFRELDGLYAHCLPERVPAPRMVKYNRVLAEELGLNVDVFKVTESAEIFSGNQLPTGAMTIAQAYAGHQFGNFSQQLGDGRALLMGEVVDRRGMRRDIQFKGSGCTPFSRNGDGKAALGPMLREYLMGEAMFNLGIPTTRALAVVSTGEDVQRDSVLPGAILTRIASSHIRVGTFEYFSSRQDYESVQRLADYTIRRHYPDLIDRPYLEFLLAVSARQAELIARWMCVGFIHGVMNTDNVAISGETIDYGPCAFMEQYDPATVFSSIDRQGRYAFGNQPRIAQWNLTRFAETLLPLIDRDPERSIQLATTAVEAFYEQYQDAWLGMMRHKLGLACPEADDAQLALDFLDALLEGKADYILAWRNLSDAAESNLAPLRSLFSGGSEKIERWLPRWKARLTREKGTAAEIATAMRQVNPYLIARNYLVEQALEAATINHDLTPFDKLLDALSDPYSERESAYLFAKSAPAEHTASYHTFCGT